MGSCWASIRAANWIGQNVRTVCRARCKHLPRYACGAICICGKFVARLLEAQLKRIGLPAFIIWWYLLWHALVAEILYSRTNPILPYQSHAPIQIPYSRTNPPLQKWNTRRKGDANNTEYRSVVGPYLAISLCIPFSAASWIVVGALVSSSSSFRWSYALGFPKFLLAANQAKACQSYFYPHLRASKSFQKLSNKVESFEEWQFIRKL